MKSFAFVLRLRNTNSSVHLDSVKLDSAADFWTPVVNAPAAMPNGDSITRALGLNLRFSLFPQPCPICHLYNPTPAESYSSPCHLLQSNPLPNWAIPNGPSYSPDFVPFSMEHNSARAQSEMICRIKMDLWAQPCLPSVVSQH